VLWQPRADDPPGDPHGSRPHPALLRLRVAEVVAAANLMLAVGAAERYPARSAAKP
jgi:hypothetical protein